MDYTKKDAEVKMELLSMTVEEIVKKGAEDILKKSSSMRNRGFS